MLKQAEEKLTFQEIDHKMKSTSKFWDGLTRLFVEEHILVIFPFEFCFYRYLEWIYDRAKIADFSNFEKP